MYTYPFPGVMSTTGASVRCVLCSTCSSCQALALAVTTEIGSAVDLQTVPHVHHNRSALIGTENSYEHTRQGNILSHDFYDGMYAFQSARGYSVN